MSEILAYNPLAQISETFSWQTAVNPAWSAEERIALRDDPSLSITYSYAIDSDAKLADFYAFSETNLGISTRIPMWSSPHFHPGSVLSAATSFSLTDSLLHYYLSPGDEVILWKSATSYIALVISTISSGAISFTTSLGFNFSAFYILPLLTGRFNKAMNFTKGSGGRKRAGFVFDVLNFVLPDPYSGYRVDKVLQSSEFSTATKQDREIVKSNLGIYENLPTSALIKESWRGGFNFASPSDLVDFLILLKALKGRAVSFTFPYGYLSPTGTSTVVLSSDSISIEHSFPRRAAVSVELEGILDPTYEIYAASSSVSEGQTLGFTVLTTLVPDGTILYYTILDITTEGIADVSPISGSVVISSGSATFNLSALTDALTEGNETFQVELRTISISGTVVAISQVVSISDPIIQYTKFLLDSSGTHGSSTILDTSPYAATISKQGSGVTRDTSLVPFAGGASLHFNGTSSLFVTPANGAGVFSRPSYQAFTIDGWFYSTSSAEQELFMNIAVWASAMGWRFALNVLSSPSFYAIAGNSGTAGALSNEPSSLNTWHHFEMSRTDNGGNSNTLRIFLDGVLKSTLTTTNIVVEGNQFGTTTPYIGSWFGASTYFQGNIAYLRVLHDIALHTASFTPPTTAPDPNF